MRKTAAEINEFEKVLGDHIRHLNARYGFVGLPDETRLKLQYGRYVFGEALDELIRKHDFHPVDSAELRIRNTEAALDGELAPPVKNPRALAGFPVEEESVRMALFFVSNLNSTAAFMRFLEINQLQVPDLTRMSKIPKSSVNSFVEGIPLRRGLFLRLCQVLKANGDNVETYFMRLLWAQMYCREGLFKDISLQSMSALQHKRLFALLVYWRKHQDFLQKVSDLRLEI